MYPIKAIALQVEYHETIEGAGITCAAADRQFLFQLEILDYDRKHPPVVSTLGQTKGFVQLFHALFHVKYVCLPQSIG
jgi:hypothetical protein